MKDITKIDSSPLWTSYRDEKGEVVTKVIDFDTLSYEQKFDWYSPICSKSEIDRILDMQNGNDYILRLRADTIIDNMRLYRVMLHHVMEASQRGVEWSLEKYFTAYGYIEFKHSLSPEMQQKVADVSYGNIFTNEANGLVFESPFGVCSIFSHSLRYFVEFASLAMLDFDEYEVPFEVRHSAMRIAVRTMLGKEALDFDLDPRGIIPQKIQSMIIAPYPHITTFIAGHEYSHYLNGDLKKGNTVDQFLFKARFEDDTDYRKIHGYNISQKQEFSADLGAMNYPLFDDEYYSVYYYYTLLWFAMLAIQESVEDYIFPPMGYQKHPGARARYQNIIDNARRPYNFEENAKLYLETLPELVDFWIKIMKEDVGLHFEEYERYGSVYLAAPNTAWRGRELTDRVDY